MHQKLRGAPVIYLVGFMGCGKSTVGRLLAERLGWPFVDLDEEIERRSARPIAEMFDRDGEARFRELEHEALSEQLHLARHGLPRVLALGGGAFAEARNRESMGGEGASIWLDCRLETLWQRVSAESHRPLARDRGRFVALYQERLVFYRSADFTVAGEGSPQQIVESILGLPLFT